MRTFRLIEQRPTSGCFEIQIEGDLDLAVTDQLAESIARASERDRILINLERCEFIDSMGIAVILGACAERPRGRGIAIFGCSDQVLRIFEVTGLTDNGLVFRNAMEALAAGEA